MERDTHEHPIRVLFVCMGNICRSPLAEGLFRDKVRRAGLEEYFEIASAGTGDWHVGQSPDDRMQATAQRYDLDISAQRAQQFTAEDFGRYDHIFVMDKGNLHDVLFLDERDERDEHGGKVRLFRELDPEPEGFQVPDPYAGGREGFERVYAIAERTTQALLDRLVDEHGLGEGERGREGDENASG